MVPKSAICDLAWSQQRKFVVKTITSIIDDEILIIENGGEMPEVTFHGCLYFLGSDPDGPQLTLGHHEMQLLKLAVVEGYCKIIRRDLTLANRAQGTYRGLARSLVNIQRLRRFCHREGLELQMDTAMVELCEQLHDFMVGEYADVTLHQRPTCINCSFDDLGRLFVLTGFDSSRLPTGWQVMIGK
jgi:hypothetical protein